MEKQTLGATIASLRKAHGMTQLDLSAGFGMVVVNELSNGVLPGYLYTPESLVTGGYETDTSMLGEGFGRKLMDAVLDTVETVK